MKTYVYLFFCLFSLMGFQACSNDEVDNVKTTTSNDVEAVSASSSLITSEEAKNNIPAFTEAIEAENTLLGLSSRATSMDAFSEDYDFSVQQKITSKEKGGIVYLVQSKTNKDNFLALYENPDGIILNVKKININANDKEAIVALSKIDDTYFFTAQAEKEQSVVNILSYNDKILTISQTRNGCSLSIGGAGIIWGTAFGALSMGAGAAASLVFLLMIMKKNLLFILFLVMPIALIGISIYNKDIERIERAFYFLLSICGAYIMSSLKEAKNIKISKRTKKIIILSFIGALFSIFVFFFLENIYLGCIIASMIAIYPFSLIYKEQKC